MHYIFLCSFGRFTNLFEHVWNRNFFCFKSLNELLLTCFQNITSHNNITLHVVLELVKISNNIRFHIHGMCRQSSYISRCKKKCARVLQCRFLLHFLLQLLVYDAKSQILILRLFFFSMRRILHIIIVGGIDDFWVEIFHIYRFWKK